MPDNNPALSPSNGLLQALTREGVLIAVSIRFWRAAKKLQASDLGLDPDDITNRLISLGHKKLLPSDALAPFALIESRAHALIEGNSFPFLNGLGHFLPNRKLTEVTAKLERLETEFQSAHAEFMRRYADLREDALVEWREAARKLVNDPERFVAAIEAAFPPSNKLGRYFHFSVSLYQVNAPDGLQADLITTADHEAIVQARAQAASQARASIDAGVEGFVQDCVANLREQTADLCAEMLAAMRTGKTGVHQKTLNRLVDFIDKVKALNFAGDRELETRLEEVRKAFLTRAASEYRDNTSAKQRLTRGIEKLADTARELARSDTSEIVASFGQMGVRRLNLTKDKAA